MKYKKFTLYVDNKNKQKFKEGNISEDELKMINHGFKVKENNMNNKEKLPYIILLKKVNNIRDGNPNIFDRTIYFEEKDKEFAKKQLIASFKIISKGRDKRSLQNLGFLTKQNLEFISSLEKENEEIKEKNKKRGKK